MLKKNVINASKSELSDDDFASIIRQQPNYKNFGFKLKLAAFNAIDSTKVADKRIAKNEKIKQKNQKLREKEQRINKKRIEKAKAKNKEWYTKKVIQLKDTVDPKMFFSEWLKYKFGEAPVIYDSIHAIKTTEQINVFLKKKGYYYGNTSYDVLFKKNKKAIVTYNIQPGPRYYIDSFYIKGNNNSITNTYQQLLKKGKVETLKNKPFDSEYLDNYRNQIAEYMRDESFYAFSFSSIDFEVDTTIGNYKTNLGIRFSDRMIQHEDYSDSIITVPYQSFLVNDVYFHILDTLEMKGNYKKQIEKLNLPMYTDGNITTIDTMVFKDVYFNNTEKKKRSIPKQIDSLNTNRIATFYYNGKTFIRPGIIELQNYLEKNNYYKEYYLERSYSRLLQLDVFSVIKPQLKEIEGTNKIDVHYYLVPDKKQHFSFEPKATSSSGFLGVSTSLNYNNRNLFRGAEKLTFSLSGGFESQPLIFDETIDGQKLNKSERNFNTLEFEPGIKIDLPGLLPIKRGVYMAKRQRARTIIATSVNYQNRGQNEFNRRSFQFSYFWKFYGAETQIFQIGLPTSAVIKFINIEQSDVFKQKLNQLNDVFLRSTYSDQFIWQDWKIIYEYNTTEKKNKKTKSNIYYKTTFDPAGNILSAFKKYQDTNQLGQRTIFGLGYSQFVRLDNEIIYAQPIGKKRSVNMRLLAGMGAPYGNTKTSLPYDYAFFGGGANDNRGWRARTMSPGIYKYYLDSNRTITQVGDVRFAFSAEYRFPLGGYFKGAFFTDIGNIWTWNEDNNRPGSQFTANWYKQLAVSCGLGLRVDLDFFVVRLDLGMPLSIPSLPKGSQWIFQSKKAYFEELLNTPGIDIKTALLPFFPALHFGIGYPF